MIEILQNATLIHCTPQPEALLERIARVCYNSEDKMACDCADGQCAKCRARRETFLGNLRQRGHESVFEHASATFLLVTDRGITHEIVRHRLASFTQSSTRYIKYDDDLPVVKPFFAQPEQEAAWREAVLAAEATYRAMLAAGVPPQTARDVLPTCTAAKLFVTANFREWRHILTLRLARGAHPKVRRLAAMIWRELSSRCPVYFADLEKECTDL